MVRERVLSGANDVDSGPEQELRDSSVRGARTWVLRTLLAVTSVALLATSPPDEYYYLFEAATEGTATLTSEAPDARFVVTVRVNALGPDGSDSTRWATSKLHGVVTTEGATGRFVSVGAGDGADPDPDEALEVEEQLGFAGITLRGVGAVAVERQRA